eukprot:UN30458
MKTKTLQMLLIRTFLIFPLQSFTPFCSFYLMWRYFTRSGRKRRKFYIQILVKLFSFWSVLEVSFYIYYRFRLYMLNARSYRPLKPLGTPKAHFEKILKAVVDLDETLQKNKQLSSSSFTSDSSSHNTLQINHKLNDKSLRKSSGNLETMMRRIYSLGEGLTKINRY